MHDANHVAGWKAVTARVHRRGSVIFQQLFHLGRKGHSDRIPDGRLPVAPSPIAAFGTAMTQTGRQLFEVPIELSQTEIHQIVGEFSLAAGLSSAAGFDGIEVHAANGYLIDQFLRDSTNRRNDRYGGSIKKRVRFLFEVLESVMAAFPSKLVGVRISPHTNTDGTSDSAPLELFSYLAEQLSLQKVAYLHIVESSLLPHNEQLMPNLRQKFSGPIIACGDYDRERGIAAISRGNADLIAFGRPFIANPDLVERLAAKIPLAKLDERWLNDGDDHGYNDYPPYKLTSL
jgi:N-ethylmaleimide reductase